MNNQLWNDVLNHLHQTAPYQPANDYVLAAFNHGAEQHVHKIVEAVNVYADVCAQRRNISIPQALRDNMIGVVDAMAGNIASRDASFMHCLDAEQRLDIELCIDRCNVYSKEIKAARSGGHMPSAVGAVPETEVRQFVRREHSVNDTRAHGGEFEVGESVPSNESPVRSKTRAELVQERLDRLNEESDAAGNVSAVKAKLHNPRPATTTTPVLEPESEPDVKSDIRVPKPTLMTINLEVKGAMDYMKHQTKRLLEVQRNVDDTEGAGNIQQLPTFDSVLLAHTAPSKDMKSPVLTLPLSDTLVASKEELLTMTELGRFTSDLGCNQVTVASSTVIELIRLYNTASDYDLDTAFNGRLTNLGKAANGSLREVHAAYAEIMKVASGAVKDNLMALDKIATKEFNDFLKQIGDRNAVDSFLDDYPHAEKAWSEHEMFDIYFGNYAASPIDGDELFTYQEMIESDKRSACVPTIGHMLARRITNVFDTIEGDSAAALANYLKLEVGGELNERQCATVKLSPITLMCLPVGCLSDGVVQLLTHADTDEVSDGLLEKFADFLNVVSFQYILAVSKNPATKFYLVTRDHIWMEVTIPPSGDKKIHLRVL